MSPNAPAGGGGVMRGISMPWMDTVDPNKVAFTQAILDRLHGPSPFAQLFGAAVGENPSQAAMMHPKFIPGAGLAAMLHAKEANADEVSSDAIRELELPAGLKDRILYDSYRMNFGRQPKRDELDAAHLNAYGKFNPFDIR